ncbi:hypothetical protein H6796_02165 [Candidatus Nomurabacteria bacterium]|nr:hypothetical protein [Candidatus Nomurabacteria bacterium]
MKQAIMIWSTALSIVFISLSFKLHEMLFSFLVTGVVPGTATVIPANTMLGLYAALAIVIAFFIILRRVDNKPLKPAEPSVHRSSFLPKRRFS